MRLWVCAWSRERIASSFGDESVIVIDRIRIELELGLGSRVRFSVRVKGKSQVGLRVRGHVFKLTF